MTATAERTNVKQSRELARDWVDLIVLPADRRFVFERLVRLHASRTSRTRSKTWNIAIRPGPSCASPRRDHDSIF
jgi:hypothetical protein